MSKILTVSVAGAILLAAGSVSYHYLYTVPKQQAFAQCVQTYPPEWGESVSMSLFATPASMCQKGYSLSQLRQLFVEKARIVAQDFKSQGADLTSQSVKDAMATKVKESVRDELNR